MQITKTRVLAKRPSSKNARGGSSPAASQERGSFPAASQEEGRELPSSFPRGRARGWQEPQKPRSLVGSKKCNILNNRNKEKAYFRRVKPNLEFGDPTRSRSPPPGGAGSLAFLFLMVTRCRLMSKYCSGSKKCHENALRGPSARELGRASQNGFWGRSRSEP